MSSDLKNKEIDSQKPNNYLFREMCEQWRSGVFDGMPAMVSAMDSYKSESNNPCDRTTRVIAHNRINAISRLDCPLSRYPLAVGVCVVPNSPVIKLVANRVNSNLRDQGFQCEGWH